MVSGESHASWNKVRRNAGNLNSFFFLLLLSCFNFFFSQNQIYWRRSFFSFFRSVSVHLSLSVWPLTPVSHFYTSAQKHLKYFLHMSGSIWILFCTLIFLYRFRVTVTCSVFFFFSTGQLLLTSLTGHCKLRQHDCPYLFSLPCICFGVHETLWWYKDDKPIAFTLAERVPRCLPEPVCECQTSKGNPADEASAESSINTPLLIQHCTQGLWEHTCLDGRKKQKACRPACPRMSPARGVLIRSLMTQLYKPAWPWKWDAAVA